MLYEFGETVRQIEPDAFDKNTLTAGVLPLSDLTGPDAGRFGFGDSCMEECAKPDARFRSSVEIAEDHIFSVLSIRNISDIYRDHDRVGLFVAKNLFLLVTIVDENGSVGRTFDETVRRVGAKAVSIEQIVCFFFEQLLSKDGGALEAYEERIVHLEEQIEKGTTGRGFNGEILSLRRKLLIAHNYYEQLYEIAETFAENEAELFCQKRLRYFRSLQDRILRLSANTQLLRDSLAQAREAYQAALDYGANRIMKVFTVVTTVFLPLTLIVGWYGMNFKAMPELTWKFGYPGVILLSVAVVVVCFLFFRRKKLL